MPQISRIKQIFLFATNYTNFHKFFLIPLLRENSCNSWQHFFNPLIREICGKKKKKTRPNSRVFY
ncbi:hypothetical protein D0817_15935 [Flavobacterium cupreum]|uniref:Uncharacterized protein n=1 Tax=Flavobacterium cupreum TaxID=2133766 RepID=A0A434A4T1_9FLAO|nr:hypothetical protein D0817_15935 [Flavobacterium cupreum]